MHKKGQLPMRALVACAHIAIFIGLAQGAAIDISTCNKAKGCFGIPSSCISGNSSSSCDALATWTDQGTKIAFEVSTKTDGYVALGTWEGTSGNKMSPATVMDCIRSSTTITVRYSKNTGFSNSAQTGAGLAVTSTEFANGRVRCLFTRDKVVTGFPTFGNNSYILLLAYGPVTSGVKQMHTARIASDLAVSFESKSQVISTSSSTASDKLVKAHACCMIFAWVLFACVGIMLARHYKDMWPSAKPGAKPKWFLLHVICNLMAMVLTLIGFIIIFAHVEGWSYLVNEDRVMRCHPYLGTLVTILAILNPLMALCRPDPNAPSRWLFNLFHWMFGFSAQVLGLLMIFVGLKLDVSKSISSDWMIILLLVYVVIYFIIDLILLILRCLPATKARTASEIEMRGNGDVVPNNSPPEKPPRSGLRTFLFAVVFIGSVAVSLAVAIGIGEKHST